MFSRIISNLFNRGAIEVSAVKQKSGTSISEDDEVELLKLKYDKLQYIEEKEKERDKTVENKASMFIGSTSIMGAIIIGCANWALDGEHVYSYVNTCVLVFVLILMFCLGRSIVYAVLTLRKRKFWCLGIDDLQDTINKKEFYTKLIDSTIRIIKHNQTVINSKVDLMQNAQQSFVSFWIWSGVFFANLLAYHVFHAYGIGITWDSMFRAFVTVLLSAVVYWAADYLVESLKRADGDNDVPDVEEEIRSVCMMAIGREEKSGREANSGKNH